LRRTIPAITALVLGLLLPAVALGAEEEEAAPKEHVTEFMLIGIGALILLGIVIAAIEAKRSK
jgi:hypothetical protein